MLFLDLDGVLADFVGSACDVHGKPVDDVNCWDFFEAWGLDEDGFWAPINAAGRDFWSNLKSYPWFDELVSLVEDVDPQFTICTKPSHQADCMAGKLDWIHAQFGSKFRRYIFTPNKSPLAARGRLLIDDSNDNCRGFSDAGGDVACFPQPWNYNRDRMSERMLYVQGKLDHFATRATA